MRKNLVISIISCCVFNTAIAGLLTVIKNGGNFKENFISSQFIGLSIFAVSSSVILLVQSRVRRLIFLLLTFPLSMGVGITLSVWTTGCDDWSDSTVWSSLVISFFFGVIGITMFFLWFKVNQLNDEVNRRRLNEIDSERRQVEAQLRLLQAQIEPHFLFNTLANVNSLIDPSPDQAKELLERLNDWLRIALFRTRSAQATLGDEIDILNNYLKILKIRFGASLRWQMTVSDALRTMPFPPMLLQPLVENAVVHGIEPKLGGGKITIRAREENHRLIVEVSDTGIGLNRSKAAGGGAGLANVRNRLEALYSGAGQLALEERAGGGTTATLELPGKKRVN